MTAQAKKKNPPDENVPAPDPTGSEDLKKIKRVALDLHSDGIDHWQDEPQPPYGRNRTRGGHKDSKE